MNGTQNLSDSGAKLKYLTFSGASFGVQDITDPAIASRLLIIGPFLQLERDGRFFPPGCQSIACADDQTALVDNLTIEIGAAN
ncbi:MAG: hypothetical protein ABSG46_10995 [Candidatus Binataceae bacterium]